MKVAVKNKMKTIKLAASAFSFAFLLVGQASAAVECIPTKSTNGIRSVRIVNQGALLGRESYSFGMLVGLRDRAMQACKNAVVDACEHTGLVKTERIKYMEKGDWGTVTYRYARNKTTDATYDSIEECQFEAADSAVSSLKETNIVAINRSIISSGPAMSSFSWEKAHP